MQCRLCRQPKDLATRLLRKSPFFGGQISRSESALIRTPEDYFRTHEARIGLCVAINISIPPLLKSTIVRATRLTSSDLSSHPAHPKRDSRSQAMLRLQSAVPPSPIYEGLPQRAASPSGHLHSSGRNARFCRVECCLPWRLPVVRAIAECVPPSDHVEAKHPKVCVYLARSPRIPDNEPHKPIQN